MLYGIVSLTTCEVLQYAAFVRHIIKHLFHKYLRPIIFEYKSDVTIIIKLHRVTRLLLVALY